jgi:hypothetical protein
MQLRITAESLRSNDIEFYAASTAVQIADAELVAQLPAHTRDDNFAVEVQPSKQPVFRSPTVDPQLNKDQFTPWPSAICNRVLSLTNTTQGG